MSMPGNTRMMGPRVAAQVARVNKAVGMVLPIPAPVRLAAAADGDSAGISRNQ